MRSQNYEYFKDIHYLFLLQSVSYSNPICPLVFSKTRILVFDIQRLTNTFVNKNILTFFQINNSNSFFSTTSNHIDSKIHILKMNGYQFELNKAFLNELVFQNLEFFDYFGKINRIEADIFKSFAKLKAIRLAVQHLSALFHRDIKWLILLNEKTLIDLKQPLPAPVVKKNGKANFMILIIHQTLLNINLYRYPNEDICLFKHFPHKNFVLPLLNPESILECTCTHLFLIQYAYSLKNFIIDYTINYPVNYFYFEENI